MAQVSAGALIALNDFHYLPQPLRQMAGYQLDHHYVLPNAFHFFIGLVWFGLVWFGLVWFGLFGYPFSHMCNTGHVNYTLPFIT